MSIAAALKSKGMFDGVVKALDSMIVNIDKESKADADEKDWCKDEVHKNEQEAARYEYKKEKSEAKLGRLNAKLDELKAILLSTIKEIKETEETLQQLTDQRNADHTAYEVAK